MDRMGAYEPPALCLPLHCAAAFPAPRRPRQLNDPQIIRRSEESGDSVGFQGPFSKLRHLGIEVLRLLPALPQPGNCGPGKLPVASARHAPRGPAAPLSRCAPAGHHLSRRGVIPLPACDQRTGVRFGPGRGREAVPCVLTKLCLPASGLPPGSAACPWPSCTPAARRRPGTQWDLSEHPIDGGPTEERLVFLGWASLSGSTF